MDKTLFDLYTDYLLSSFGQVSATTLSRLVDGAVSYDQITRMLARAPQHSPQLWQKVKPLVRQVQSAEGVIIIDDSISEKPYTDENELICWHWDHAKDRPVKGINFLTALYQVPGVSLPVAFDLVTKTETYLDPKTGQEKRRSPLSKHDRLRTLLRACVHNEIPFGYVLADLWFAAADNMKFIVLGLHKHFVFPLKENRTVALSAEAQKKGCVIAVDTLDLPVGQTQQIWLEDVPFPVLLTKEVFPNKDGSTGVRYLVTDDLTLTDDAIIKLYQRRWSVEVYHESRKQHAALEQSPTRTETTRAQPFLCQFMCLRQARKSENQDGGKPLCLALKALFGGSENSLSRICQT